MSKMAQPNYKEDLRLIREELKSFSEELSKIKYLITKIWKIEDKTEDSNKLYPWHLSNTTTTADYYDEED